jgi:hypothetical protein
MIDQHNVYLNNYKLNNLKNYISNKYTILTIK